jgi:type II secretory pathway pseudopilin PulG
MNTSRRRGYTFIDLIIVLVIVLLLCGMLAPAMHSARSASDIVKCGSNLRQIGQAMMLYANENKGEFPRTRWDFSKPQPTHYSNWATADPFSISGPVPNDVTAALFLLLRTQDITPGVFICPSDTAEPWSYSGATVDKRSNFPNGNHLSYSLQNCYPGSGVKDKFAWTNTLKADYAIAADMNPGSPAVLSVNLSTTGTALQAANSANHEYAGQNILYGDLHVEFLPSPFAGVNQDNIYGAGRLNADGTIDPIAYAIIAPPAHWQDSVLLPPALGKPMHLPPSRFFSPGSIYWFTYAAAIGFIGVIVAFTLALRKPRSKPAVA